MSNKNLRDANESRIVSYLRNMGCTVQLLHGTTTGLPDLLVGFRKQNFLFEIKTENGKRSPGQIRWHENWRGQVHTIRTIDEAIDILNQYTT